MEKTFRFHAFISYCHHDTWAAQKLQALLEGYKKGFKVFRDVDELTTGILSEELRKKLDESKFLIVICSEHSAQSEYVGDEIAYFRSLGRERQIIPFVIGGNNKEGVHDVHTCMHRQLTMGDLELLAIDIHAERSRFKSVRFHKAFIRVVAKMLDLDYGVLWNKRKHKMIRRACWLALLCVAVISALTYFAFKAYSGKPFDRKIILREAGGQTNLPLSSDGRDSVFVIFQGQGDIRRFRINSLRDTIVLKNLPGSLKEVQAVVACDAFGCFQTDTTLCLSEDLTLEVARNPETFGRIRHYVKESNGLTPVVGAVFDFGCISAVTDSCGLLDVLIPLEYQQPGRYAVKVLHKGIERKIAWQPELEPQLGRTEIYDIVLEK